jgi:hypothetical protein
MRAWPSARSRSARRAPTSAHDRASPTTSDPLPTRGRARWSTGPSMVPSSASTRWAARTSAAWATGGSSRDRRPASQPGRGQAGGGVNLPTVGAPKSDSYEGDGYVIVRHPDTDVVKRGAQDHHRDGPHPLRLKRRTSARTSSPACKPWRSSTACGWVSSPTSPRRGCRRRSGPGSRDTIGSATRWIQPSWWRPRAPIRRSGAASTACSATWRRCSCRWPGRARRWASRAWTWPPRSTFATRTA